MDIKRKREYIDKLLVDIQNAKNVTDFYCICTKLFYRINEYVFYMENEKMCCERKEENVSNNTTNIN